MQRFYFVFILMAKIRNNLITFDNNSEKLHAIKLILSFAAGI